MRKHNRKLFAILLAALMTVQCITPAFAEVTDPVAEETVVEAVDTEVEEAEETAGSEETPAAETKEEPESEEKTEKAEKAASLNKEDKEESEKVEEDSEEAEETAKASDDKKSVDAEEETAIEEASFGETVEFGDVLGIETVEAVEVVEEVTDSLGMEVPALGTSLLGAPSTLGDLWDGWDTVGSDAANRPGGTGTETDPYVIETLGNLMWLSFNTAKGTAGKSNEYYVLNANLDYSGVSATFGDWHPIGWAVDSGSPNTVHPFSGHFDGQGYTISGINICDTSKNLQNVGLFGILDDAEVKNLKVEAETVSGYDYVGILAGQVTGNTEIHYVEVSGFACAGILTGSAASASAHVGGITGNANGDALTAEGSVILENCTLTNVRLNSTGGLSTVGGIAGTAQNAYIVDSTVVAESNGFQGRGYVGGIAGSQSNTVIYEAYIDGTIGGNSSVAAGGVTGIWRNGGKNEIFIVQMDGEIGATNQPTTHEGIIVGTREPNSTFVYGTNKTDNVGYIFYNEQLKGKGICGSGYTGDANGAPKSAETGYWTDNELRYVVVEGSNTYPCDSDRFFYEELEDGVRFVITSKLNRQFTVQDYANGLRFAIDHFAPGVNGSPVLGHLLTIPVINAQNSPTDLDVATFSAIAGDGSIYYKKMDKDSCAAVSAGTIVKVISAPKNKPEDNKFFQRVVDEGVDPEKVKRPTYTDSTSGTTEVYDMDYQTGGEYTFTMPDSDCEINIFYELVLSGIWTEPDATTIRIVETRTGDRKKPDVTWTIKDENGNTLCNSEVMSCPAEGAAITWQLLDNQKVTPVAIAIKFNNVSSTNAVMWSVDDDRLINKDATETSWTTKSAQIKPEMTTYNSWLCDIIASAEEKQKNNNYTTTIPSTVYEKTAVLTATTDPDHSVNNISAYAHCDVTFEFQIIDETSLLVEGVELDKDSLTFTVKRKVTGHRRAPVTTWEVTNEQALKATIIPDESNVRSVTWELTGDAATAFETLSPTGTYNHDVAIDLNFDGSTTNDLPDWMKELYEADNTAKAADLNYVMNQSGSKTATVKVTAEDRELKVHTAEATITLNYVTEDTTVDVTDFELDTDSLVYTVTRTLSGDRTNPTESYTITSPKKITGFLSADAPFLEDVTWAYDSAITLAVTKKLSGDFKEENLIGVNFDPENIESAPAWIGNVIRADDDKWKEDKKYWQRSASASVSGYITATANDVTLPDGSAEKAQCLVTINFQTVDETVIHPEGVEMNPVEINKKLTIEKKGDINSATVAQTGFTSESITNLVIPNLSFIDEHLPYNRSVKWTVSDDDIVSITQDGILSINQSSKWLKEIQANAPYKGQKTVYVYCTAVDNGKVGATKVNISYETILVEQEFDAKNVELKLTATGSSSSPVYTWTGADPFTVAAKTYPDDREVTYSSSDPSAVSIDADGKVTINTDRNQQWIKDAMSKSPYTAEKTVTLTAKDGNHADTAIIKLSFSYKNSTYSSSSSSGGGGGGGGVSGGGTTVGTGLTKTVTGLPTYVISGTWVQSADKTWRFTSGRTYTAEWACVFNPYASGDQAQFDWFRFDNNSVMVHGWFDDPDDGNRYYLWPLEDGTQGHMCVGCQYIEGAWYYFNEKSDGTRGKLMRSAEAVSSEGKTITTDASGRIIAVNGAIEGISTLQPTPNTTASLIASGVISSGVVVGSSTGTGPGGGTTGTTASGYTIVSNVRAGY